MDKKEFSLFAAALKTYYPREQLLPNEQAMELWYRQLKDIPFKVAEVSLNKWVATNKWSPSIAEIREACAEITTGKLPDWSEGWEATMKAIRRYGSYRPKEAMDSLDEITRECVKRIGYREMCLSENIGYFRTTFKTVYESLATRKKIDNQLPPAITKLIEDMRGQNRLELKE